MNDKNYVYAFSRNYHGETIKVLMNAGDATREAKLSWPDSNKAQEIHDLLSEKRYKVKSGKVTIKLNSFEGAVLSEINR